MRNMKRVFFVIVISILIVLIPVVIDWCIFANSVPSNISNGEWAGFLGSYIGGVFTMIGVFITIEYSKKETADQRKIHEEEQKEEKRLGIMPYLDTRFTYFDKDVYVGPNDRIFIIHNEEIMRSQTRFNSRQKAQIEVDAKKASSNTLFIDYIIRNVGAGSAVNMTLKINNFEEKIAIAKDETVHIFCMVTFDSVQCAELAIRMEYTDVENRGFYLKDDIIHFEKDEENCWSSRYEKREEQSLNLSSSKSSKDSM